MEIEIINPFERLESLSPDTWINIPDPLQNALNCMKACLLDYKKFSEETTRNVFLNSSGTSKRFEIFENSMNLLKNMIVSLDENTKNRIFETKDTLTEEINIFRKSVNKDLDFKQKSMDKKVNSIEENCFFMRKIVDSMPNSAEIDNRINTSSKITKELVKSEIIENFIAPEVRLLNEKIEILNSNTENFRKTTEKNIENLYKMSQNLKDDMIESNEKIENEIQTMESQFREDFNSTEKGIMLVKDENIKINAKNQENLKLSGLQIEKLHRTMQLYEGKLAEMKSDLNRVRDMVINQPQEPVEKNTVRKEKKKNKNTPKIEEEPLKKKTAKPSADKSKEKKNDHLISEEKKHYNTEMHENSLGQENHENKTGKNDFIPTKVMEKIENKSVSSNFSIQISENSEKPRQSNGEIHDKSPNPRREVKQTSPRPMKKESNLEKKEEKSPPLSPFPLSIDDLASKPSTLPKFSQEKVSELESKLKKYLEDSIFALENSFKKEKLEMDLVLKEIKEKLSWFPISLTDIKGKSPNEARLFTLEARLRQEENSRVEHYNRLLVQMNNFVQEVISNNRTTNLPMLPSGRLATAMVKKSSSEAISMGETSKNFEGSLYSNATEQKKMKPKPSHERRLSLDFDFFPKKALNYMRKATIDNCVS